ncbi:MAG: hypothetical protein PHP08_00530 [Candidatus Dojkabacteria bacterium]|nr:hypothetical protein [Candidatus Dojkabacteria bacterium]
MKNKTIIATALLVAGLLLLSGCVDNNAKNNSLVITSTPVSTVTTKELVNDSLPVTKISQNATYKSNTSSNLSTSTENNKSSEALIPASPGWCVPGEKITVSGKQLIIQGLVMESSVNASLCYAKSVQSNNDTNTTTNYYFNQNKTIERMNSSSVSTSGNSSATAFASSNISII